MCKAKVLARTCHFHNNLEGNFYYLKVYLSAVNVVPRFL